MIEMVEFVLREEEKLDEAKELKTRLDAFRACWSWLESWVDSNTEEEEKK